MLPSSLCDHYVQGLWRDSVFGGLNPQQYHPHLWAVAMHQDHSCIIGHEQSDRTGKRVSGFSLAAWILGVGQKGIASKSQDCRPNQDQASSGIIRAGSIPLCIMRSNMKIEVLISIGMLRSHPPLTSAFVGCSSRFKPEMNSSIRSCKNGFSISTSS